MFSFLNKILIPKEVIYFGDLKWNAVYMDETEFAIVTEENNSTVAIRSSAGTRLASKEWVLTKFEVI